MKFAKTLVAVVAACAIAGCNINNKLIYKGEISGKKVKYEKVYSSPLGYEPDYRMTVSFPNGEMWVMIDDNMDNKIKPGEDVVMITKDSGTIRYRGITPLTKHVMIEADSLYQSMLKEIEKELEKKKREPISNKGYNY